MECQLEAISKAREPYTAPKKLYKPLPTLPRVEQMNSQNHTLRTEMKPPINPGFWNSAKTFKWALSTTILL